MTSFTGWRSLVLTLAVAPLAGCKPECESKVVQEVPSPDGTYKATVYSSLCGFNIDSNTQVSIIPASAEAGGRSNVFAANASGAEKAHGPYGGPRVTPRWVGRKTLEIAYDTAGSLVRHEKRYQDFTVIYRPLHVP